MHRHNRLGRDISKKMLPCALIGALCEKRKSKAVAAVTFSKGIVDVAIAEASIL